MRFFLMQRDHQVAVIEIAEKTGDIIDVAEILSAQRIPLGAKHINGSFDVLSLRKWWAGRGIPASRSGLEHALEKSAEHGYRTIEFAYLRPELFDLDRLAKKAQALDVHLSQAFVQRYRAHIDHEENQLLPLAHQLLSADELEQIGGTMSARRRD